jgi:hypothetical protein
LTRPESRFLIGSRPERSYAVGFSRMGPIGPKIPAAPSVGPRGRDGPVQAGTASSVPIDSRNIAADRIRARNSSTVRLPFDWLQWPHARAKFSGTSSPPRIRGRRWSTVEFLNRTRRPQYSQCGSIASRAARQSARAASAPTDATFLAIQSTTDVNQGPAK